MSPTPPTASAADALPTAAEMTARLIAVVPEADRAAARALLEDKLLPWRLRSLPTHPKPRRLAELVEQGIADALAAAADDRRLAALEELACDDQAGQLVEAAISVAVARYVLARGEPTAKGLEGYLAPARAYAGQDAAALAAEADRIAAAIDRWAADAGARFPGCAARHRPSLLHTQTALGSARSGSFATASGPFHSFLVQAGEKPALLDVH